MDLSDRKILRRQFVKAAIAIGGASALSACQERERGQASDSPTATGANDTEPAHPQGPDDLASLPERQFAWNKYLVRDTSGNTVLPQHQVILFLNYSESGTPTGDERDEVDAAFRTLDRAFQRGTAGDQGMVINPGLLYTVGYSRSYFDRFDASLPAEAAVTPPVDVLQEVEEDPGVAEPYDAVVILSADKGSIVLGAEQALRGELDRLNGVAVEGSLGPIFEVAERRSGFIGRGLPADRIENEEIPENTPQAMGFKSGFKDNQATEDRVSIDEGPFAGGTTQMVSRIQMDIDSWYDDSRTERVHRMFSPVHSPDEVGTVGENLAADSRITPETADGVEAHAEEYGTVGHTQKVARARDDDFEPRILRRSESNATDTHEEGIVALNFTSLQRTMDAFVETRKAMHGDDLDVAEAHNGILEALETVSRATFLMPPRGHRALPTPQPS